MVTAKFHIIGDSSPWYRLRVQEEITSQGLEGSVVEADNSKLAVVIEGERSKIMELYKNLEESSPGGVMLADISFRRNEDKATDTGEIVELLREIERNTRRINQKLDVLVKKMQPVAEETSEERQESSEAVAESSFAAMFGD